MCGRYSLSVTGKLLAQVFGVNLRQDLKPRYNIAPMQMAPVIRASREGGRQLDLMQWGLIPSWAEDPKIGNQTINARAESASQKPMFRSAFKQRRCLIPANGFYEWQKNGKTKQPYLIRRTDGEPFAFGGLWEHWRGKDGHEIDSFTILTTQPNEFLKPIHNRMPVIVDPKDYDRWLDPKQEQVEPRLLQPIAADRLAAIRVSPHVNKPANDDPLCIQPLPDQPTDSLFPA